MGPKLQVRGYCLIGCVVSSIGDAGFVEGVLGVVFIRLLCAFATLGELLLGGVVLGSLRADVSSPMSTVRLLGRICIYSQVSRDHAVRISV